MLIATDITCGRYAPSPSGPLHLGNLRTALLAWLQARLAGGRFIMRLDDLDQARVRPGSAEQIFADLAWLGLDWDEGPDGGGEYAPYSQSQRDHHYSQAFGQLVAQGRVYGCICSRKDIASAVAAPHQPGYATRYPGTCKTQRWRPTAANQFSLAWRFAVDRSAVACDDQICEPITQDLAAEVGDFVLRRRDGVYAYQLANVVDDALMGVTTVVRGCDLLDSAPRQIALQRALGFSQPQYWHVPLMTDQSGQRLAKRDGSIALAGLVEQGMTPTRLVGELAHSCGLIEQPGCLSALELLQQLELEQLRCKLQSISSA